MIVDDDPSVRLMMGSVLESLDISFDEAEDGVQALLLLENVLPDLLLLDVMMPGMDGFEVCAHLKETPGLSEIPVMMLTGSDDVLSIQRAYDLGVTDFVAKPIPWSLIGYRISFLMRASNAFSNLKKNERRLAQAQRLAGMGSWEWDIQSDKMWFSNEVQQIFHLDPLGFDSSFQAFINAFHPVDRNLILETTRQAIASNSSFSIDHQLLLNDGKSCFVHTEASVITDQHGVPIRLEGSIQDITVRKEAENQIHQLAFFDILTGLPNRALFLDNLKRINSRHQTDHNRYAILFVDIDGFKGINDTLGHPAGDYLLQQLSLRLKDSVRSHEFASAGTVARLGGDEFVVIIENLKNSDDVAIVAQRIIDNIRRPVQLEAAEVVVTASVGISIFPEDGQDPDTLIKHADIAMYSAKENGKNMFHYFSRTMHETATFKLEMEKELRGAIAKDEFTMHYQPQVDLLTKHILRFEALIRWNNQKLGAVLPGVFIPIAEKNSLICEIDRWVISHVCRQINVWQATGMSVMQIAINISGRSLSRKDLAPFIRQELDNYGIDPTLLQIEITEGVLMLDADVTIAALNELKQIGISLAMDDFGTGYSSLQYLQSMPVDTLKIDRSFVKTITDINEKNPLISAIIALAESLGLDVIAEGIESEVQKNYLSFHDCRVGQGYLFSRPVPAEEVPALFRSCREGKTSRETGIQDITGRKRVNETLRLTRFSIDHSSDGFFWMTPDARIIDVNDAACRSLGYSREELLQLSVPDIDPFYIADVWRQHFADLRQHGSQTFETVHTTKDGIQFPVEIVANYIQFGSEECNCAIVRNITERKQTEMALRKSEENFRTIIEVSPVPLAMNDEYGNITYLNQAFVQTIGYTMSDIPNLEAWWTRAYPDPQYRKSVAESWMINLEEAKRTNSPFVPLEANIVCKDNSVRTLVCSATPIENGFVGNHLVILYDITDRKKAEEEKQTFASPSQPSP